MLHTRYGRRVLEWVDSRAAREARARFNGLTLSEKRFLRAMSKLGAGIQRTGIQRTADVANILGVTVASLGPVRAKLWKKGMIYNVAHGDMDHVFPAFDEVMARAIRESKSKGGD